MLTGIVGKVYTCLKNGGVLLTDLFDNFFSEVIHTYPQLMNRLFSIFASIIKQEF